MVPLEWVSSQPTDSLFKGTFSSNGFNQWWSASYDWSSGDRHALSILWSTKKKILAKNRREGQRKGGREDGPQRFYSRNGYFYSIVTKCVMLK